ncbi:hypothetical protein PR048_005745 [Dryococelus australis]|uniref:Uncharacterized protein n=1 Tax=Dryococelus australis TaxID=614101 RepID=A0ABQ9I912_9NEOP|nr:hypothetical protein PR048_005745 [Dryococelus australis]
MSYPPVIASAIYRPNRRVLKSCQPFVLGTPGRQWIFGGDLSRVEGRAVRPFWALLFTDLILFAKVSRDRVLFITEEPLPLLSVTQAFFNIRKKASNPIHTAFGSRIGRKATKCCDTETGRAQPASSVYLVLGYAVSMASAVQRVSYPFKILFDPVTVLMRRSTNDFRLLVAGGSEGTDSPVQGGCGPELQLTRHPKKGPRRRPITLRAPTAELKAVWQNLIQRQMDRGGVVVRLLASDLDEQGSIPGGSLPHFRTWGSRCWSAGLLGDFPPAPPSYSCADPYSSHSIPIDPKDLDIKSPPNLSAPTQLQLTRSTHIYLNTIRGGTPASSPLDSPDPPTTLSVATLDSLSLRRQVRPFPTPPRVSPALSAHASPRRCLSR